MHSLLVKGGHLAGVLFNQEFEGGPPYGGTAQEYKLMFSKKFTIKTLELCYNSIERRKGSEVFINLVGMDFMISSIIRNTGFNFIFIKCCLGFKVIGFISPDFFK